MQACAPSKLTQDQMPDKSPLAFFCFRFIPEKAHTSPQGTNANSGSATVAQLVERRTCNARVAGS